jgi:hypothetical protein
MPEQFLFDWQTLMVAIQLWLAGGNPYPGYMYEGRALHAGWYVYPPPSLLIGAPFALLPRQVSGVLMLLVSIVGFEYWVRRTSQRSGLLWLVLWLPLWQGVWIGQVTLLALVGFALAELAYKDRRDVYAGALIALALLKPQTVILPAAWFLFMALRERRWQVLLSFGSVVVVLWGGILLVSGPMIYQTWFAALSGYDDYLPNRPLLFPPFGLLMGILAAAFWWRFGQRDHVGALLLLNTFIYPLSVIYAAVGVAFVVIRRRPDWPWYPLIVSWFIPLIFVVERTPDMIAALTQSIIATGLLAGVCPVIPWRRGVAALIRTRQITS